MALKGMTDAEYIDFLKTKYNEVLGEADALRARVADLEAANAEWQEKHRGERRLREEQRDIVEAAEQRAASLQAEVEIECQARVAAANEREEQRSIADFQQHRAEEAEKALAESKLDVGRVAAERDSLLYSNKLLRERRDELQAEVEKLTSDLEHARNLAAEEHVMRQDAENAIAESERKRADLLAEHQAELALVRSRGW